MQQRQKLQLEREMDLVKLEHAPAKNRASFKFVDFDPYFNELRKFFSLLQANSEIPYPNIVFKYCQKFENWDVGALMIQKLYRRKIQNLVKWQRVKKNWGRHDLRILIWIVNKYAGIFQISCVQQFKPEQWDDISKLIPCVSGKSCMFKILSLHKVKINEYPWNEAESSSLIKLVEQYGTGDWKKIAEGLFQGNQHENKIFRNAKQCKEHWVCYLNPILRKGPWSKEEDAILLREVIEHKGTKKWTQISKILEGRTQNSVKNRFNLLLQKEQKNHTQVFNDIRLAKFALENIVTQSNQSSSESISENNFIKKQEEVNLIQAIDKKEEIDVMNVGNGQINEKQNLNQAFNLPPINLPSTLSASNSSAFSVPTQFLQSRKENKSFSILEGEVIPCFCLFFWPAQ